MSSRTVLSRPRTRVYDCNYNIGQSYYKPMMDHLDRKYSGRPTELPPAYPARAPQEEDPFRSRRSAPILDFPEEEMEIPRRKPLTNALSDFDDIFANRPSARGGRGGSITNGASNGFDAAAEEALDEVSASMRRLRASRAARAAEDLDDEMESLASRRRLKVTQRQERESSLTDRALESVGIRKLASDIDDDLITKKRTLRITSNVEADRNADLTKWSKVSGATPLALESPSEAAAISRARQTRNRLQDLESEMEEMAEKSAMREKRAAQLRSLVAEAAERAADEDVSTVRVRATMRSEKKTVNF